MYVSYLQPVKPKALYSEDVISSKPLIFPEVAIFPDAYSLYSNNTEEDIAVLYLKFVEVCHFSVSEKDGVVFVNKVFASDVCCSDKIRYLKSLYRRNVINGINYES